MKLALFTSVLILVFGVGSAGSQSSDTVTPELTSLANKVSRSAFALGLTEPTVIVSDFVDVQGVYSHFGAYVADKISEFLSDTVGITVVNRHSLQVLLDEITLQVSGLVSRGDQVRVGEFTGASAIVTGSIVDLGESIELNAEVTSIATGVVRSASQRIEKNRSNMLIIDALIDAESAYAEGLSFVTASLEAQIEQRQAELDDLLENGRREIERRLSEEETEKRAELAQVEAELREKSAILSELQRREEELSEVEQRVAEIEARIRGVNDRFQFLRVGMKTSDVEQVLGEHVDITLTLGGSTPSDYERAFNSNWYSAHGRYMISWNDQNHQYAVVVGWYDTISRQVYRVSP